ncbi:hypothetical protein BH18ACI4_BH18ACI4_23120 [soil metagenome]
MIDVQVTIVVVPRERFSYTSRSLESIYEHTDIPFSLVYVDGGSPARIRRYLTQKARQNKFKLLRTEHYLSPNQARNLGLQQVESKYVVFVDNDVLVSPGWLQALVDCAEKTGAWVVSPLTLIDSTGAQTVHSAGGTVNVKENQGQRVFHSNHSFAGMSLADVASDLHFQPTELGEFHCMLILTEAGHRTGPFDEQLFSIPRGGRFLSCGAGKRRLSLLRTSECHHLRLSTPFSLVRPSFFHAALERSLELRQPPAFPSQMGTGQRRQAHCDCE